MRLNMLKKGDNAKIDHIDAPKIIRDRFHSLGIINGEEVKLKEVSLAKQTLEIEINNSLLILRGSEAEKIYIIRKDD